MAFILNLYSTLVIYARGILDVLKLNGIVFSDMEYTSDKVLNI